METDSQINKKDLPFFETAIKREESLIHDKVECWIQILKSCNYHYRESSLNDFLQLPKNITFHIIRHGETELNVKGLVSGQKNTKLTQKGTLQAYEVGNKLRKEYNIAICSTLDRSFKTLLITLIKHNIHTNFIFKDPRLDERNLGILEKRPWTYIDEFSSGDLKFAPKNGENYLSVLFRVLLFLSDVVRFTHLTNSSSVLISTHMGPMRILKGVFERIDKSALVLNSTFDNTEVLKFTTNKIYFPKFGIQQ